MANNIYDTINYIDYGLIGIIVILSLGILCLYQELISSRHNKEHWKTIALERERLHKMIDNAGIEMEKRVDAMIKRIKNKNAE